MVKAARRLVSVWRSSGTSGLVRFILSRLFRHRRDLIFESDTAGRPCEWEKPGRLLLLDRTNIDKALTPGLREWLGEAEEEQYLSGLRDSDLLLVVSDERGEFQHHSYVLFNTRTKTLLGESFGTPLFAHCVTAEQARGKQIYPSALQYGLGILNSRGYSRAVINCDPSNLASISGIKRAGFSWLADTETWIICSRLGLQRRRERSNKVRFRLYLG